MGSWIKKSVDGISTYVSRGKSPVYTDTSDFKVINQACVFPGSLRLHNLKFVTELYWNALPKDKRISPSDILVNSTGTGTLGRIGFVPDCIEDSLTYDSHVTVVRVNHELYSWKFIYYLFQSEDFKSAIEAFCTTGSTNQIELVREAFLNLDLKLPKNKFEQTRIAQILSTVDEAIAATEALIAKYSRIKTGLMQDLLTRGIDEKGYIRSKNTNCFVIKNGIEVPEEWEVTELEKLSTKIADRDHTTPKYVQDGIYIVSPKDFNEADEIDFSKCQRISLDAHNINSRKTNIEVDDLIFTRIGAGLGKVCKVTMQMPIFSILHSACMIKPNQSKLLPDYLLYYIKSWFAQKQIKDGIQSIGVPDLGMDKIRSFLIKHPLNMNEQKKIVDTLVSQDELLRKERKELAKLTSIKVGLMQDLLTGKVQVSDNTLILQIS